MNNVGAKAKHLQRMICVLVTAAAAYLIGCQGLGVSPPGAGDPIGTATATNPQGIKAVNHIIIELQENRSFDTYFGMLGTYRAENGYGSADDIDGLPAGATNPADDGTIVPAFHFRTACIENLTPDWLESHGDYNLDQPGSTMFFGNGFVHNAQGMATSNNFTDVKGLRAMGYYDGDDLPYYYFMASNFATSDRWFSPMLGNSNPNHMYIVAATTHGHAHDPGSFDSNQVKTIFQLLDNANVTWKIYYQELDSSGKPETALARFEPYFSQHQANVVPVSEYLNDVQNGTLPQVAYIEDPIGFDEHPGGNQSGSTTTGNNVQQGAQLMQTYINELMGSSSWKDSVFIMTYDEGGGTYDHVSPQPAVSPDGIPPQDLEPKDVQYIVPSADFTRTGFRVPLLVISPFAKKSYVSHTVADYTAILKFVETRFGLPSLTKRDKAQMNMMEFFNFDSPPWVNPPTPPLQPLNLPCDVTLLP